MGLDKMIRFDGPDFCGKEALQKEGANPPNRFVTLVVDGPVPEYGAAVTKDGAPAGTLTSPCESPTLGKVIGLAVVRSDLAAPGESLEVAVGDGHASATVAPVPLYDTDKTRPRA
jgi:aminomethyltransferase